MDYSELGFIRLAAVAPELKLGNPLANAERIGAHLDTLKAEGAALALFPELSLTGYSCEDLFFSADLHRGCRAALADIARHTNGIVAVVGAPWLLQDGRLLNTAVVLAEGRIAGVVPKISPPNYGEFYELRWFASGADVHEVVGGESGYLVSARQLFEVGGTVFGIEICEDLWAPRPPGIEHALAGAEIVVNPSASNELVAKADYRRDLVHMASARGICGYAYAGSGPSESTKDVVFGGHLLIAENGQLVAESRRFSLDAHSVLADLDLGRLRHDRMHNTTFRGAARPAGYARVATGVTRPPLESLIRDVDPHPFVPQDEALFHARAAEILNIQVTGLARRMLAAGSRHLVIGV